MPVAPARRGASGRVAGRLASERFDLVVLSEIGYYFEPDGLAALRTGRLGSLEPGGTLMAVHWRGQSDVHVLSGDTVHAVPRATAGGVAPPRALRGGPLPPRRMDPAVSRWSVGVEESGPRRGGSPERLLGVGAAGRRPSRALVDKVEVVVVADACRDSTVRVAELDGAGLGSGAHRRDRQRRRGRAPLVSAAYLARHDHALESTWLASTDADTVVPETVARSPARSGPPRRRPARPASSQSTPSPITSSTVPARWPGSTTARWTTT